MHEKIQLCCEDLPKVNQSVNWRALFAALGLVMDRQSQPDDLWARSPFHPEENTASFHLNQAGFFCHSTGRHGDFIRLIQELHGVDSYTAARWLIGHGLAKGYGSSCEEEMNSFPEPPDPIKTNTPTRHNLEPFLSQQGTHPEFVRRGIGVKTCKRLRCGYLDPAQSTARLAGRLVWQVREVVMQPDGRFKSVILTHIGRALTEEDEAKDGKWWHYPGFHKSLALYGLELALTKEARRQAQETGQIVLVEGCFDVAKMVEAGLFNTVATFGASLSTEQANRLLWLSEQLGVNRVLVAYDRDKAGEQGQDMAQEALHRVGLVAAGFDWQHGFPSPVRGLVAFPKEVNDVCDFEVQQLIWLRKQGLL